MTRNSTRAGHVLPLVLGITVATGVSFVPRDAMAQTARASQGVKISDLDLATDTGRHLLDARIDAAAHRVCRLEEIRTGMNIRPTETAGCYMQARAATRERVAEAVAAARRSGQPAQVRIERRADLP
jgi:UrcA family protein